MASTKAYVPSQALLRALTRPQPPRCPCSRRLYATARHGPRHKSSKAGKPYRPQKLVSPKTPIQQIEPISANTAFVPRLAELEKELQRIKEYQASPQYEKDLETRMNEVETRVLTDEDIEKGRFRKFNYYEQDIYQTSPPRLVESVTTAEDAKRVRDNYQKIKYHIENKNNPEYDPAPMRKQLLDKLIAKPEFADLTDVLMDLKQTIRTREEEAAAEAEAVVFAEQERQELDQQYRKIYHDTFQDLVNDPNIGDAKDDVQELLNKVMHVEGFEDPEFRDLFQRTMTKIGNNPAIEERYGKMLEGQDLQQQEQEWAKQEQELRQAIDELETKDPAPAVDNIYDEDDLVRQMQDVLKDLGGDPDLELELEEMLSEEEADDGDLESRDLQPEELVKELQKLTEKEDVQRQLKLDLRTQRDAEENIPAEIQAKVDKIMADPKLMEKLMYIKSVIEENERQKADITSIAHEVAPDPYQLDPSRTTTLQERLDVVRSDPEHMEAINRLHVKLNPPFNIAPALKAFNQAIEMAYVGANDDIRRVLWRTYQKARTLPTFMQNMSDDAWDILYYSQAVTWGSNQNRQDHLRVLITDLRSMGRDGPPTHPNTLVKNGDGDALQL